MTFQGDWMVDRRRLKWRLTAWQIIAVAAIVAAAVVVLRFSLDIGRGPQIARVDVKGIISDSPDRAKILANLADSDSVKAVIVRINSPGGTVVGGESIYKQLRAIAQKKPVVAVLREVATSAAYMAALGCDHIVASDGTMTGSIGVIVQTANVTGLLESIGIKPETIKSSPLKAQPNPLEPFTPAARKAMQDVIDDVYSGFVSLVATRRDMDRDHALKLADGRVFTGRQAKSLGLVDALGGEPEARKWLADEKSINPNLEVRDVQTEKGDSWLEAIFGVFGKTLFSEQVRLDGVLSLWHLSR